MLSPGVPLFKNQNFLAEILPEKAMGAGVGAGVASGLIYISVGDKWGVSCFPVSARLGPKTPRWFNLCQGWRKILEGEKP